MKYSWVPNISCEIREGKAYLANEYKKKMQCSGACHSCIAFLGVDLQDTGKEYYRSGCIARKKNGSDRRVTA